MIEGLSYLTPQFKAITNLSQLFAAIFTHVGLSKKKAYLRFILSNNLVSVFIVHLSPILCLISLSSIYSVLSFALEIIID